MKQAGRLLALLAICAIALQLFFIGRIALMAVVDPHSTSFERSEIARIAVSARPGDDLVRIDEANGVVTDQI